MAKRRRKGRAAQVARFKRAARKCKGKPNYRSCMRKELRKK